MPLLSTTYESKALAACYGDNHSSEWPDSFTLQLWDGDPREDGTAELPSDGGYAGVTVTNDSTSFPAPDTGMETSDLVSFPISTDAWPVEALWAVLVDGTTLVEGVPLLDPIDVDVAGTTVGVSLSIFHNDVA